jgi:rubrerythrin
MEHAYGPVFSNLAKACEKQFRTREAELLWKLSGYFDGAVPTVGEVLSSGRADRAGPSLDARKPASFQGLAAALAADETEHFDSIKTEATAAKDRGALRMTVWGSKVNAIQQSVVERYAKQGDALLQDKSVFVCEACGFIFIGQEAPEICPVCKAPRSRFSKIS